MGQTEPYDLPDILPVLPLTGALLLPHAQIPLNIFEPRYVDLIDDALQGRRLVGMVQAREDGKSSVLYDIGCAGRIISFDEVEPQRYLVTLQGICRFRVLEEQSSECKYRILKVSSAEFIKDLGNTPCFGFKAGALFEILQAYFTKYDMDMDWDVLAQAPDEKIISALSMICPLTPGEKQALLEAEDCKARGALLQAILEMEVHPKNNFS